MSDNSNDDFISFSEDPILNPNVKNMNMGTVTNYAKLQSELAEIARNHLKEIVEEIPPDMNDEQLEDFVEDYLYKYDRIVNLICGKETTADLLANMALRLTVYKNSVSQEEYDTRMTQAILQFQQEVLHENFDFNQDMGIPVETKSNDELSNDELSNDELSNDEL